MGQKLNIILGTFVWFLILTLGSPFLAFFLFWRFLSRSAVRLFYNPKDFEPLNFYDTIAGMQEVGLMISYALHAHKRISLEELRSHFFNTFIKDGRSEKFPVFFYSCTTVLGYGYKKRMVKNLDLEYHIREETMVGSNLDKAVMDIMGQNDRLRGSNRPKWEIVLLHIPAQNKSTMIFKINHALADAYSYFYLLNKLTGSEAPYIVKELSQSRFQKLTTILKAPVNFVLWLKEVRFGDGSVFPFGFDVGKARVEDSNGAFTGDRSKLPKLFSAVSVDFRKVKEISKMAGVKILHVLLSLHYGALKAAAEKVANGRKIEHKEPLSITYMLPMPKHPAIFEGKCTNHLTCGTLNLNMGASDRISQLREIERLSEKNFRANMPEIVDMIYYIFSLFLPRALIIIYEIAQLGADLHLVTPFVSANNYQLLGVPVERLQLLFNGDDIQYVNGIAFGSITKGDEIEITIGSSHEIFLTQEELDFHVHKRIPAELESLYIDCKKVK